MGHGRQKEMSSTPIIEEKDPGGQGIGANDPSKQKNPAGQGMQSEVADFPVIELKEPLGHGVGKPEKIGQ